MLGDRGLLSPGDLGIMMLDGEVLACPLLYLMAKVKAYVLPRVNQGLNAFCK